MVNKMTAFGFIFVKSVKLRGQKELGAAEDSVLYFLLTRPPKNKILLRPSMKSVLPR